MKILTGILLGLCSIAQAQTGISEAKHPSDVFQSSKDSINYAIGQRIALEYMQKEFYDLDVDKITMGIKDVLSKKSTLLTRQEADIVTMRILGPRVVNTIIAGQHFLQTNRERHNVHVTSSGMQYEVLKAGEGRKLTPSDTIVAHYVGHHIDGKEFDNTYRRNEPITFTLRQMIPGWFEGLQLMEIGARYKFYFPYTLVYGTNERFGIPGGSALIFEIEILEIK